MYVQMRIRAPNTLSYGLKTKILTACFVSDQLAHEGHSHRREADDGPDAGLRQSMWSLYDVPQVPAILTPRSQHMNLVLADTEEFRKIRSKQAKAGSTPGAGASQTVETEAKRTLGLTIVRGAHIVSLSVESPPPADPSARLGKTTAGGISSTLAAGQGVAKAAGRGAPVPPPSLAVRVPFVQMIGPDDG